MYVFQEYDQCKKRFAETQKRYAEIMDEKEELFAMTQPNAVDTEKERVSGGKPVNAFDQYLIQKQKLRIDERLLEIKELLDDRERLLEIKEEELYESRHVYDKIYRLKYLERYRVYRIAMNVGYSESHVFRILKFIQNMIGNESLNPLQ
ncbi:MAG: hypothetical protein IJI45_18485 [Anaerolineaceae bacterium]|nr:hypothetical protein [Anaerolineaceae bacterium]